jgi:hypothetical protein
MVEVVIENEDAVEAELVDESKPEPKQIVRGKPIRKGKLKIFVVILIVCSLLMLALGYFLSYYYPIKRHEFGDGDPNTHELIIREDPALTNTVYGDGRNTRDLDIFILQTIDAATIDGEFRSNEYLSKVESLMAKINDSKPAEKYQPVDITFNTRSGDCVAKATLEAYLLHYVGIPFQVISFRPVDKNGVQKTGHMICVYYFSLQNFTSSIDNVIQIYNTRMFYPIGQAIDYVALWKIPWR